MLKIKIIFSTLDRTDLEQWPTLLFEPFDIIGEVKVIPDVNHLQGEIVDVLFIITYLTNVPSTQQIL